MKVIKIEKISRNNKLNQFLVLLNENTKDEINELVDEWCEKDLSGMNYGYTKSWSFVEDKKIINEKIKFKINLLNQKIITLRNRKIEMENYLIY